MSQFESQLKGQQTIFKSATSQFEMEIFERVNDQLRAITVQKEDGKKVA